MKKGISLITISVLVLVLLILVSVIGVSITKSYNEARKLEILTELNMVQTAVENYKASNGTLPITNEIFELSEIPDKIKNEQFSGETSNESYTFNAIDYSLIGITSLKYGKGATKDDKYVVSTLTGKVYYVKGIQVGNEIYYTSDKKVMGILSGKIDANINSEEAITYNEEYKNGNFQVTIMIPKVYTVLENGVQFEGDTLNLDAEKTNSDYNVYMCYPNKIGTIRVRYLNAKSNEKISKHIVYNAKLALNTETKGIVTLMFDANGGNCDIEKIEQTAGYAIKMPVAQKIGHTFNGWYTEATGGTKREYTTMPSSSEVLYAHYTVNNYIVTYNANSGTVSPSSFTVAYDSQYGTLATPRRSGYEFLGWYTNLEVGTKVESTTRHTTPNDITIYAHWKKQEKRTLTLDANGGTFSNGNTTKTITEVVGKSITIPSPTRTAYKFLGWYTAASGGSKVNYTTMPSTNQTIYAHWDGPYEIWFTNGPVVSGGLSSNTETPVPAGCTIYYGLGGTDNCSASVTCGNNVYTSGSGNFTISSSKNIYLNSSINNTWVDRGDGISICVTIGSSTAGISRIVGADGTEYALRTRNNTGGGSYGVIVN